MNQNASDTIPVVDIASVDTTTAEWIKIPIPELNTALDASR